MRPVVRFPVVLLTTSVFGIVTGASLLCPRLDLFATALGAAAAQAPSGQAAPAPPSAAATARADQVLVDARKALGGDKLAAARSFVATGRTQQIQGDNLVPIEFEISCERPDKYLRKDEVPARENGPTAVGFNADMLILLPKPATPLADPARLGRLNATRQDFTRLMLGLFAGSFGNESLTFRYAGQAEAPQGQADVLDVAGPGGFAARFFVNRDTHLPLMVSWSVPGRGTPPVENRLYYSDYRDVNGLQWPFRIRRAVGANTVEETTFDRFRINARIDAKVFGVQ